MSNYAQSTFFANKDNLATGNPSKKILGSDVDVEFGAISTAISSKLDTPPIPSSTKMVFIENAAPSGWTLASISDDSVLLLENTAAQGGATGGSWTITGFTIPAHNHNANASSIAASNNTVFGTQNPGNVTTFVADTHTHPAPNVSVANANLTVAQNNNSWRPKYTKAIVCSKN
jgi:hypothetical protein